MRDFFAFRKMIAASVIQVIFVIGLVGVVIVSIAAVANDQSLAGLLLLVFGGLYWRIVCEVFIVLFRMNNSLMVIAANTAPASSSALPGTGSAQNPTPPTAADPAPIPGEADVAEAAPTGVLAREGWYDDSERPGHKRWWDGTAWGIRDDEHPSGS